MMSLDTIARLRAVFESHFDGPIEGFGASTSPAEVQKWDSTAHIELIMEIERIFAIEFTASELARLTNVGAIGKVVDGKLAR